MKIFVINLEKDIERRNSIQSQLDKLNVSFEFVSGIYGKDLTDSELSMSYDNFKSKRTQSRSLTRSEIGCALSHIKTYKEIIDKNIELALILEDDVVIPDNLLQVLLKVEKMIGVNIPQVTLLSPVKLYKTQLYKVIIYEIYSLLQYKKGYFDYPNDEIYKKCCNEYQDKSISRYVHGFDAAKSDDEKNKEIELVGKITNGDNE